MEALFLITVLGCSDSLEHCEAVRRAEIAAQNVEQCHRAAQSLAVETPVDFPMTSYLCERVGAPQLRIAKADASPIVK